MLLDQTASCPDLEVTGTLQNHQPIGFSPTLTVNGDLEVTGLVQDDPAGRNLHLDVAGNVILSGVLRNYSLTFISSSNHTIAADPGKIFRMRFFENDGYGITVALTDLLFENTTISFNWELLNMAGFKLDMNDGNTNEVEINANGGEVELSNGAYMLRTRVEDVDLYGNIQVWDSVFLEVLLPTMTPFKTWMAVLIES